MALTDARTKDRTGAFMLTRLLGAQLAAAMALLGIQALTPALRDEFDLSRGGAGLLVTAAFLGVVIGSWPAGTMVNTAGVRRSMIVACVGLGAVFALTGIAWSFFSVLPFLFVIGLFYSAVTPATNAGVVAWAAPGFRTRAMAIKQMGVTGGASLSAALIPLLIAADGWRTAAVVVGAIVAVGGYLTSNWFRRPEAAREATRAGRLENRKLVVAVGFATFLLLFVQHCVATHFILALRDRGVALVAAGAALSLLQLCATGARFGWAWVADRPLQGNAALASVILGVASAGVLAAMTFADAAQVPILAAVLLGVTTQAGNGLMQIVLADSGGAAPAASSGLGMAIGFSGAVVGPPVFGFMADAWTYRSSWIYIGIAALGAGVLTWRAARQIPR